MRWDTTKLTFCYCRSEDYVDHLNQDLTPEQAQAKRERLAEKRKEKEIAEGLVEEDYSSAS